MFESRSERYRSPTGAVAAGTPVYLTLRIPKDFCTSSVLMVVEQMDKKTVTQALVRGGEEGENERWQGAFIPKHPGLYFYHFSLHTDHGVRDLYQGEGGVAVAYGAGRWQLTAYRRAYQAPSWLYGGLFYQIFPDRFCAAKDSHPVIAGRSMHESWDDPVVWRPNEAGEITNSDYFGGDLKGIEEKLPYLQRLGVTCLYLNPIFEAHSNHRYNTANYERIDPMLGSEADFTALCKTAKALGISVVLDGVFSHTGSDSIYFNREGRYQTLGAYQSQSSPYHSWYRFSAWPDRYDSWWGFDTLPNVEETQADYLAYINGEGGIVRRWLKAGAAGWRLDVADELPDVFLDALTEAAKKERPDALVLGEVWEDASNKSAYGVQRRYLQGKQLDTVMNYPFREGILNYLCHGGEGQFFEMIESILEHYPPEAVHLLMNHIGTHDTERALTMLAGAPLEGRDRAWQDAQRLTEEQRTLGVARLRLASFLQYSLPGIPCVYYGDEAGMEGYRDPFNRGTYPWEKADADLVNWYEALGAFRKRNQDVLATGGYRRIGMSEDVIAFGRFQQTQGKEIGLLVLVNRGCQTRTVEKSWILSDAIRVFGAETRDAVWTLPPYACGAYRYVQVTPEADERPCFALQVPPEGAGQERKGT